MEASILHDAGQRPGTGHLVPCLPGRVDGIPCESDGVLVSRPLAGRARVDRQGLFDQRAVHGGGPLDCGVDLGRTPLAAHDVQQVYPASVIVDSHESPDRVVA